MRTLLIRSFTAVWIILLVAVALSWYLGAAPLGVPLHHHVYATVGLLSIAFFKARLIGIYFMELGTAPWPLRIAFEIWTVAVCAALVAAYLIYR